MNIKFALVKKVGLVLSVLALATLVSGCSVRTTTPAPAKVITVWGFDDPDVWKPMIKDASKTVKGYEITYVQKSLDANYEIDSLNSILSGKGPDVWAIPSDWTYRHLDKITPMPDSQAKAINLDDQFVPVIKQNGYINNKIYSLAPTVDTLMVYYNAKLFDQVQSEYSSNKSLTSDQKKVINKYLSGGSLPTWTDLVEASKYITKKSGDTIERSGIALGTSNNVGRATDVLYALMLQNETKMTSDNFDTATFNLPTDKNADPGKASLDFFRSFSDPGSPNYSWNSSMPSDIEAFTSGKTAMMIGYESLINTFSQKYPDFKYKRYPLPQLTNDSSGIKDYASYTTFVVPKLSAYPTQAWQVIGALVGNSSSSYSTSVRVASSVKKKNFTPSIAERASSNPGTIQAQTATAWTKGRYPLNVNQIFAEMIQSVASGAGDSKSALDLASSKTTDLLRKATW